MTKLQQFQKRQDAQRQQRERQLAQPPIKAITPDMPYIPPVDGRQGGFVTSRVVIRDAQGRYVEL